DARADRLDGNARSGDHGAAGVGDASGDGSGLTQQGRGANEEEEQRSHSAPSSRGLGAFRFSEYHNSTAVNALTASQRDTIESSMAKYPTTGNRRRRRPKRAGFSRCRCRSGWSTYV